MRHRRPQPGAPSHATQPRRIRAPDRTRRPPAHLTHLTTITSARVAAGCSNTGLRRRPHLPNPTARVCEPYGSSPGIGGSSSIKIHARPRVPDRARLSNRLPAEVRSTPTALPNQLPSKRNRIFGTHRCQNDVPPVDRHILSVGPEYWHPTPSIRLRTPVRSRRRRPRVGREAGTSPASRQSISLLLADQQVVTANRA